MVTLAGHRDLDLTAPCDSPGIRTAGEIFGCPIPTFRVDLEKLAAAAGSQADQRRGNWRQLEK